MALETAVVLLESVLPSLLDAAVLATEGPGFKDSLNGLLQPLLRLRYTDPVMVALVSCAHVRHVCWLARQADMHACLSCCQGFAHRAACGIDGMAPPYRQTSARGRSLYRASCSSCLATAPL